MSTLTLDVSQVVLMRLGVGEVNTSYGEPKPEGRTELEVYRANRANTSFTSVRR
jgi:hypothetical protein